MLIFHMLQQIMHKITIEPVRFASILYSFKINKFASLRFANLIFGNNCVGFASLDSQLNINHIRFALIFKFFNINMFFVKAPIFSKSA
jgi:hypothetical protein